MRAVRDHYLHGNAAERSPRRVVILDTETRWHETGTTEHHTLRLWVARLLIRAGDPRVTVDHDAARGHTGAELVATVEGWNRTSATTWIFAHNLAVDLCTTRIVTTLLAGGWDLGDQALTSDSPWARLSRGRRRIILVDSATWLPRSIEHLGALLRIPKRPLPENDDGEAAWFERCAGDVEILAAAMQQLMDWWDRSRLGCWSLTGTATGWNSFRHHPEPTRVVIKTDPEGRAFERSAIYAGRRECWRVGRLPARRYILIDLERAHLTAARCFPLPMRRGPWHGPLPLDDWHLDSEDWRPLADCTVRTASPRYPWRHQDRIWHPVGALRTVLAGPEFTEAQRRGDLVAVHGCHLYQLGGTMQRWSHWLTALLDGELEDTPEMAQVFAKMCSHRVFGRWAMRTSRPLEPYFSGERGWHLERGVCHPEQARMSILHVAGEARPMVHDVEGDDAFPAVLAWIQSHVRVALARLIDALDPGRLVSCNTDGVLYAAAVDPDMERLRRICHPFVPRIKAVYRDVDVVGAAHLVLDGHNHLSGVPSSAAPTGETSLAWTTWPRMRRQLELGEQDGYVREHREVDLANVPVPRWVMADNTTRPIMTMVDTLGATRVFPFVPGVSGTMTPELAPHQHPVLAGLLCAGREYGPLGIPSAGS